MRLQRKQIGAGADGIAIDFQMRDDERPQQPGPHCTLMVGGISLLRAATAAE